ncbi:UvrD-helicase domain-containing protein [Amycolatopsis eburnea]|uniref:DNA 3'-5' helicase n=1 Tax=Amycolatopsis eburnea TaxID=2267691 RepID=A0A427TGA2_9PSEU|nr:UvrD-helicase domain-containing protein [Amycolatopsis eburnea]RSD22177.1 DNA helicase UvrD [Amycolatopsis eburnea]
MATVVFAKEFQKNLSVEGSLKPRAWDLLTKLSADHDLTGLDLKIPKGARDPRVRTARVTDNHRAVLFAAGSTDDQYYLLVAIRPHDEAYEYAAQVTMRANPANGVFEVLHDTELPRPRWSRGGETEENRPLLVPYRPSELESIGILPELAARAVELVDENDLEDLCLHAPTWQAHALLDLACGLSLEQVKRRYAPQGERSVGHAIPTDVDDPAQLRDSLGRAASLMEFVVVEVDEQLRRMLTGDFAAWRLFLHPDQRHLVERARKGSFRVAGGAGTGKTVVAMHRAVALARRNPQSRVLLTTYTRNLAQQLTEHVKGLAGPDVFERIDVSGVDQLARNIVARTHGAGPRIMNEPDQLRVWASALAAVPDLPPGDRERLTPYFLMNEYEQVILGMAAPSLDGYLVEPRRGRRAKLSRLQKTRLWRVVDEFVRLMAREGKTTYTDVVAQAATIAAGADLPLANRYHHVVIDEAQDLTPAHWRLLRAVVAKGPDDLFICEDAHQRIYGERLVISRYGIETRGRSQRLTLNYRTTKQVLGFATRLLAGGNFVDLADEDESTSHYRSLLGGPEPVTHGAASWQEEKDFVVATVRSWLEEQTGQEPGAFAVLARSHEIRDEMARELLAADLPAVVMSPEQPVDFSGVQVATMHRAKGTEFARCVVMGADSDHIPHKYVFQRAEAEERVDLLARERCLLYVACTRPRDQLVVTWTGDPSSLLPSPLRTR